MTAALKIAVVALSLSLDVFAVSVGVGVGGVATSLKWRIGLAFGFAEVAMNLIGAGIGILVGTFLGDIAGYIGFGALMVLGLYMISESRSRRSGLTKLDLSKGWGLTLASLSISLDSLGIGFSILYIGVPPAITLATIAVVSVCSTGLGLALGERLGAIAQRNAGFLGGVLLTLTGLVFAILKLLHSG